MVHGYRDQRSPSCVVLDWLVKESQNLPIFTFPELALQGCATMLRVFVGVLVIELGSSCPNGRDFSD